MTGGYEMQRTVNTTRVGGAARSALCGLALLALLTACTASPPPAPGGSAAEAPAPPAKKRVLAAVFGEPTTLSDTLNATVPGGSPGVVDLEFLVHAGLSIVDDHGQRVPRLAEAVPSLDNGLWVLDPDGRMETTYKIRPNAQWHDGHPF